MSTPYVGEIRMFAGNFAPSGWAACQGQLIPISQNDTLFNLIGTTYGGDGVNTFQLPDLQGRRIVHQGSGLGLSPYVMGEFAGPEFVTLTAGQLSSHNHPVNAVAEAGTLDTPSGAVWAQWSDDPYSTASTNTSLSQSTLSIQGGNLPHENRPPFLAITFIIALFGVFPSQS